MYMTKAFQKGLNKRNMINSDWLVTMINPCDDI
jgi:hypothetical protein